MRLSVWDTDGDCAGAVGLMERIREQNSRVLEKKEIEAYIWGSWD